MYNARIFFFFFFEIGVFFTFPKLSFLGIKSILQVNDKFNKYSFFFVTHIRTCKLLTIDSQFWEQCSHFWERHRFIIANSSECNSSEYIFLKFENTRYSNMRTCMFSFLKMYVLVFENEWKTHVLIYEKACSRFWEFMYLFEKLHVLIFEKVCPRFEKVCIYFRNPTFSFLRKFVLVFKKVCIYSKKPTCSFFN